MELISLYQLANYLLLALVILFIGGIIGKVTEKMIRRILHELELNLLLRKIIGAKVLLEEAISLGIKWLVYIMTVIIALKQLGIEIIVLNILFAGIVLFCTIGLLLGLRDFIPNAVGGLLLYKKKTIKQGDIIRINDIEGKIKEMTLVQTILETKNREMIYVPNAYLVKEYFWKKRKS